MPGGCIVVHGGAGKLASESSVTACAQAAKVGAALLRNGASAVDAVEVAIKILEDVEEFDAGTGAYPNLHGEIELDAGIMAAAPARGASVAAVRSVKHPITLARRVLEETNLSCVVGSGAELLADMFKLERGSVDTEARRTLYETVRATLLSRNRRRFEGIPPIHRNAFLEQILIDGRLDDSMLLNLGDTVGAVAVDGMGYAAAGSSTGGSLMKWPGRIGSAAFQGAGFYAGPGGAAAATGHGESLIIHDVCRHVVNLMNDGAEAQSAVNLVLTQINALPGGAKRVGIIAVDSAGRPGAAVNIQDGLPNASADAEAVRVVSPNRLILLPAIPLRERAS